MQEKLILGRRVQVGLSYMPLTGQVAEQLWLRIYTLVQVHQPLQA
jgi:hypothetical protein